MTIQIDSREKARAIKKILAAFDKAGIDYFVSKLYVGDYQSYDNPYLIIDRKQNLTELCSNVTQGHERFRGNPRIICQELVNHPIGVLSQILKK